MKGLFISTLLFLCIALYGKTYYVKQGGNDSNTGVSNEQAWASINKVNSFSFSPGDSILFQSGDKFIGTLNPQSSGTSDNYIIFSSYGTGDDPIITPNEVISNLSWTMYDANIYKTTGLKYNPGNVLINGISKIHKINDYWMTNNPSDGRYGDYSPLQLLALPEDHTFSINDQDVYFWDGFDALYCYDEATGTTYLRFRDGENPNHLSFSISGKRSQAVLLNGVQYIVLQNLRIIGGEYGVDCLHIALDDTDNIIIENCIIESSNRKVYLRNTTYGIIIRNNLITNNYLSSYTPGAWVGGTEYVHGVNCHIYLFTKYRIGISQSTDADNAIGSGGGEVNRITIHDNWITNCVNGISLGKGIGSSAYNNYIEGTSSAAILFGRGTFEAEAYDNFIFNSNIAFRFQYVDDLTYGARTNYIYRNKVCNYSAGEFMYIHYGTTGPSTTTAYIYHNSIISEIGIAISDYAEDYVDPSGFVFINNILSISGLNGGQYSFCSTKENLYKFYYNWMGGTYVRASGLPDNIAVWASDASNLNNVGETFWDHSAKPANFMNIGGSEVVDAGIDLSNDFTLGESDYSGLPGISSDDFIGAPDLGAYEYPGYVEDVVYWFVYPTPSSGKINIRYQNIQSTEAEVIIQSTLGEIIYRDEFLIYPNTIKVIDLSQHPSGLYIIAIHADVERFTQRVILLN